MLPWLYLRGISTGDFSDALEALVGRDAQILSAPTISRLKKVWAKEYTDWRTRDLSSKRYVYVWADGIHAKARLDDAKLCSLSHGSPNVSPLMSHSGAVRRIYR